jgi:hypothetical protein
VTVLAFADAGQTPPDLTGLEASVGQVLQVDPTRLRATDRLARMATIRASIDALEIAFTAVVAASDAAGDAQVLAGARTTASWLKHELRLGAPDASERVRLARGTHRGERPLAAAAEAVAAGDVTFDQYRAIGRATRDLSGEPAARAARLLTELAPSVDTGQLRAAARHLRYVVDPDRGGADFERQFQQRHVTFAPLLDGMWRMEVLADAEGAAVLDAALARAMCPETADDRRTTPQRRYDALIDLARVALDRQPADTLGTTGPHLLVRCTPEALSQAWADDHRRSANPLDLAGQRQGRDSVGDAPPPAGLSDGTPLPPRTLSRISCGAAVSRVVFDPAGRLLDLGRTQRLFSRSQRLALWARDSGCRWPGCAAPWGHAHHVHPWSHGGRTDLGDGLVLCGHHHRAVHEDGWTLTVQDPLVGTAGPVTFVGPLGQTRTSRPPGPHWPLAPPAPS